MPPLTQRCLAEFLGTAFLLLGVLGSGIMAQQLTEDVGLQLLQNAFATAGTLVAIIVAFSWVSGAHFNPIVSLVAALLGELRTGDALAYLGAQMSGACAGALLANGLFGLPILQWATTDRSANNLIVSEIVASIGLLLVIWGSMRGSSPSSTPFAVAAYIGGAYYFTSSTSFANPAVTVARSLSDTFAGIDPVSVPWFVLAQLVGALIGAWLIRVVFYQGGNHQSSPS